MFRRPKDDSRYSWTNHVVGKMAQYRISESLIKRIIRFPERVEEGVAEETVAVMKKIGVKKNQEVWVMYQIKNANIRMNANKQAMSGKNKRLKIITAWRYPGKSPERNPVPKEVLEEVKEIL